MKTFLSFTGHLFCIGLFFGGLFCGGAQAQMTPYTPNNTKKKTASSSTTSNTSSKTSNTSSKTSNTSSAPSAGDFSVLGKNFLNLGIGIGSYYKGFPFGGSFEHGFTDAISAGVWLDYSSYHYPFGDRLSIVYGGVRGSYHFARLLNGSNPKFDPYAGISLGYYSVNYNGQNFAPYNNSVFFGIHAGARYLFSDVIGGFAELGYGVTPLKIGVSFAF